jgi:hypothetical protein
MSAKAKSKKDDKMVPPQGNKITSFFTRAPDAAASNPKLEKASSAVEISPAKNLPLIMEKCTPASKLTSPNTASSGAKTTLTGKNNKRRRKMGSDSEDDDDCAMDEDGAVPTGSSLAHEAILAAKEAKTCASMAKLGDVVEVQGESGDWENGKLVRHNISGTWMVQTDGGKKIEVSIPSDQIRSINGKAVVSQPSSDVVMSVVDDNKDEDEDGTLFAFGSVPGCLAHARMHDEEARRTWHHALIYVTITCVFRGSPVACKTKLEWHVGMRTNDIMHTCTLAMHAAHP